MNRVRILQTSLLLLLCIGLSACAGSGVPTLKRHHLPADQTQLSTVGIERLRYSAACALNKKTHLTVDTPNGRVEYPGELGLAPNWPKKAMTVSEQRWVSACILARSSTSGQAAIISMRNAYTDDASVLNPDQREEKTFTVYEGGFFGNVFSNEPQAYACVGEEQNTEILQAQERLCTLPNGNTTENNEAISQCNFVLTGVCKSGKYQWVGSAPWREVIHVWLKPE